MVFVNGVHALKYGFVLIVAVCFGFAVCLLFASTNMPLFSSSECICQSDDWIDGTTDHIDYASFINASVQLLNENIESCLTEYPEENSEAGVMSLNDKTPRGRKSPFFQMLENFNNITSSLHINTVILEPSVLFCMLTSEIKHLLLKRNFNVSDHMRPKNIITVAILGNDASVLEKDSSQNEFRAAGFTPVFIKEQARDWMKRQNSSSSKGYFTSHIFYTKEKLTVHVVVFHERLNYLWHADLKLQNVLKIPKISELLFVNHDSAFDDFAFVSLVYKSSALSSFNIPSTPHYFLFQIQHSKFLECDLSRGTNVLRANTKTSPSSLESFKKRTIIGIRRLRQLLQPLLMHAWIWSGTMLGWYRQCGIIPYTTDVDFAAWAAEVDDVDYLISMFKKDKQLKLVERMGLVEMALEFQLNSHGLRVDLFFIYQENNGTWYSGHRPGRGYFFKYFHPNFTICSAELLGEKVQVPCETEKVIVAEYGPNWIYPVSSWNYESSIKNRGPTIYWDKKLLKKVYPDD